MFKTLPITPAYMKAFVTLICLVLAAGLWIFKTKSENLEAEVKKLKNSATQEKELQQELDALKKEYEAFKFQRRTGMIGKKFPSLLLADVTELKNIEVRTVNAAMLTVMHESGVRRIRLADVNNLEVKWEAVWTPAEAQAEEDRIAKKDGMAAEQHRRTVEETLQRQKNADAFTNIQQAEYLRKRELDAIDTRLNQIQLRLSQLQQEYYRASNNSNYTYYSGPKIKANGPVLTRIQNEINALQSERQNLILRRINHL